MPDMMEIYQSNSFEYDELVSHEDHEKNLPAYLEEALDFRGRTVVEFGCGTGRLTAIFADNAEKIFCFDGSNHMLGKAKVNLSKWAGKIEYGICDNLAIDRAGVRGDIVLQGWSFGHTVMANSGKVDEVTDQLVKDCLSCLNPGGSVIFIESLGTNTEKAAPPTDVHAAFLSRLEEVHGFTRTVIETDYRFESESEARRIMGFFFGEEMGRNLHFAEGAVVREYTGAWLLRT